MQLSAKFSLVLRYNAHPFSNSTLQTSEILGYYILRPGLRPIGCLNWSACMQYQMCNMAKDARGKILVHLLRVSKMCHDTSCSRKELRSPRERNYMKFSQPLKVDIHSFHNINLTSLIFFFENHHMPTTPDPRLYIKHLHS
jgi:hypothetical protein